MRKLFESILLVIFQCIAVFAVFIVFILAMEALGLFLPAIMGTQLAIGVTVSTLTVHVIVILSIIIGIQLMGKSSSKASAMRTLPFPTKKTWLMTTLFTLLGASLGYGLSLSTSYAMPDYLEEIRSFVLIGALVGGLLGYHLWSLPTGRPEAGTASVGTT